MSTYQHKVSGIYSSREEAEAVLGRLLQQGMQRERLEIVEPHAPAADGETKAGSDSVLKDMLLDTAIGSAIGGGAGALGMAAIAAANVSLFVASPLLGTLTMMGWGAGVGGMAGAAIGVGNQERKFSELVKDATSKGYFVLVAHAKTAAETALAQEVISHSVQAEARAASTDTAIPASSAIEKSTPS